MKNRKVQIWAMAIASYNCEIEYIKGKNNEQADMLSRLSHDEEAEEIVSMEIGVINSNRIAADRNSNKGVPVDRKAEENSIEFPDMAKAQKEDTELKKLRKTLESSVTADTVRRRYAVVDDLLYYIRQDDEDEPHMRLMIPAKYKSAVLGQYHDQCCHWGI